MTQPKKFVFVLMPFLDDFRDIYHLGIKETAQQLNCYCERVDEQEFDGSIVERIYHQISKADIGILKFNQFKLLKPNRHSFPSLV